VVVSGPLEYGLYLLYLRSAPASSVGASTSGETTMKDNICSFDESLQQATKECLRFLQQSGQTGAGTIKEAVLEKARNALEGNAPAPGVPDIGNLFAAFGPPHGSIGDRTPEQVLEEVGRIVDRLLGPPDASAANPLRP
jgi:hypothetical protein